MESIQQSFSIQNLISCGPIFCEKVKQALTASVGEKEQAKATHSSKIFFNAFQNSIALPYSYGINGSVKFVNLFWVLHKLLKLVRINYNASFPLYFVEKCKQRKKKIMYYVTVNSCNISSVKGDGPNLICADISRT